MAFSGASVRGPLRSSRTGLDSAVSPSTASARRRGVEKAPADQAPVPADVHYANCTAAREAGAAPLLRGEPGYREAMDGDSDGVACE